MRTRKFFRAFSLLTLAVWLCACAAAPRRAGETQPAAGAAAQATTPAADRTPGARAVAPTPAPEAVRPPPADADVRAALERTYKGAVVLDGGAPRAVVGDFNGDGSEDIVVRARPAPGRLAEVNDEVANWIVSDPRAVTPPDPRQFDPHQGVQKLAPRARPRVEASDALLVVLHGYEEAGWRNPEARQTFLLRGVAGEGLRPEPRAEAQPAARERRLRLLGDVLHENLGGARGFLYWTGAGYGWLGTEGSTR
jgi:hypothetical protein